MMRHVYLTTLYHLYFLYSPDNKLCGRWSCIKTLHKDVVVYILLYWRYGSMFIINTIYHFVDSGRRAV
jgi:hypothetical protein